MHAGHSCYLAAMTLKPMHHLFAVMLVPLFPIVFTAAAAVGCSSSSELKQNLPPEAALESDDDGKADSVTTQAKSDFFGSQSFYYVTIRDWDTTRMTPESLESATATEGAQVLIYKANASSPLHCPDAEATDQNLVYSGNSFTLRTSGNFTKGTPKSSYKISFKGKSARFYGMTSLNLKAMWNDVSQMRESLAWGMFRDARVPAPRHTYAKFCINGRYYGLYSIIEQVEKAMLEEHFDENTKGNLYKAYWEDLGPADLSYRVGSDGDDSGKQYFIAENIDNRTYQLKTNENEDDPAEYQTYDDLALLIKTINGVGLDGNAPEKFNTDAYKTSVEEIFDVRGFLRWASVNVLLGAWDNYYQTPSNYYLYNSGKRGGKNAFMKTPYFHWIPWDYDNSFGTSASETKWQYGDLVDWKKTSGRSLPLIENLLANRAFRAYYLDHLDYLLANQFTLERVMQQIGDEGTGGQWDRVRTAAFLEADGPQTPPHTGRQFTNDQVYWNGFRHHELSTFALHILGIEHYVRMRYDSAVEQLLDLRSDIPLNESGVVFPDAPTMIPSVD